MDTFEPSAGRHQTGDIVPVELLVEPSGFSESDSIWIVLWTTSVSLRDVLTEPPRARQPTASAPAPTELAHIHVCYGGRELWRCSLGPDTALKRHFNHAGGRLRPSEFSFRCQPSAAEAGVPRWEVHAGLVLKRRLETALERLAEDEFPTLARRFDAQADLSSLRELRQTLLGLRQGTGAAR